MWITSHGILRIQNCSAHRVLGIGGSYSGMHDVRLLTKMLAACCKSMLKARLESRYIQMVTLKNSPTKTSYAPDGRSILYTTSGHNFGFLALGKKADGTKEEWDLSPKDLVHILLYHFLIPL
jgi:hypothetical protein